MISHYTIEQNTSKLENLSSHEEKLYYILETYIETFPILDAQLFRYSSLGHLGEGIIALDDEGMRHIGNVRDDIRAIPVVHDAIQKRKTRFLSGMDFFTSIKSDYVLPSNFSSVLVVPIFVRGFVLGYICSNKFDKRFEPMEELLDAITYFGECIGKSLSNIKTIDNHDKNILSRRELEVMRNVAMGQMAKEMAASMGISESTVKQYVKTAINKLGAKNRTHAVTILFQKGILS